jgi:ABC-2 type transport system ATP-binding protein
MHYFGELFGLNAEKRKQKTEELLTSVGLEEKDWNKQLRKFSKGMLQRVGLAQSLINDPEIVFLDEPMSGLDPIGRREIRELIANLRQHGTTVFMSTHILSDIEALCDEVAILRSGKLVATGALDDLLNKSGEHRSFEVNVTGVSAAMFDGKISAGAAISEKPSGASVVVSSENDVDTVLKLTREAGGSLVSVQPVKQSLEELFVKQTVEN